MEVELKITLKKFFRECYSNIKLMLIFFFTFICLTGKFCTPLVANNRLPWMGLGP